MKIKSLSLSLIFSSLKAADALELWVNSHSSEINGLGISSIHEGAGINYMFLGSGAETYDYDGSVISKPLAGEYRQYFQISNNIPQMSVGNQGLPVLHFDSEGILSVAGSAKGFFACKSTGDPYGYSKDRFQLMYYSTDQAPDGCLALTVSNTKPAIKTIPTALSTSTKSSGPTPTPNGKKITLKARSEDADDLNNKGIVSYHEGAGINYLFVNTFEFGAEVYYDESLSMIYAPLPDTSYQYLSIADGKIWQLAVLESFDKFTISDGCLLLNGSNDGFLGCKNTGDPYDYSRYMYQVMYTTDDSPPDGCSSIWIEASYV